MRLISPLAAGIQGAASGSAQIYRRGTSVRATLYSDFEGLVPVSTGADVALDSNGGATVYVNETVSVVVVSSAGQTVRSFVDGDASPGVEVRSQSFTGTDYDNGSGITASGATRPLSLQAALDLWKTQNLSIDWKVGVSGTEKTIAFWIASLVGLFYNVKAPDYGALGNGAADDAAAINSAITAAQNAGGGIVFFPPGTYRVTSSIALQTKVSLLGSGGNGSIIRMDHATNNVITVVGATSSYERWQKIEGLRIDSQQAHTGNLIRVTNAKLIVSGCTIGDGSLAQGNLLEADGALTSCDLSIQSCQFRIAGATAYAVTDTATGFRATLRDCVFIPPATYNGIVVRGPGLHMTDCLFRNGTVTAGTFSCVSCETGQDSVLTSNEFDNGGGSTVTAIRINSLAASNFLKEDNNHIGSTTTRYSFVAATDSARCQLNSRTLDHAQVNSEATPLSLSTTQFGSIQVRVTTLGARTINAEGNVPLGGYLRINLWNDQGGGAVVWTFGTNFNTVGTFSVGSNSMGSVLFQGVTEAGGTVQWYEVARPTAAIAE